MTVKPTTLMQTSAMTSLPAISWRGWSANELRLRRPMRDADGHPDTPPPADTPPADAPPADAPPADAPPADAPPADAPPADPLDAKSALNADEPPADDKDGDPKPKEGDELKVLGAPEAYEIALPEGMVLDAEALEVAEPIFRELNLSNEAASKLAAAYPAIAQKLTDRANQAVINEVVAQRAQWGKDALADPEIGGSPETFDASKKQAAAGLDRLGFKAGHPFRTLLDETGLGNHPEMIRAWSRVGKAVSEDVEFHRTNAAGNEPKTIGQTFYGNDYEKKGV